MTARETNESPFRKCEVEIVRCKCERNRVNDGEHQENAQASTEMDPIIRTST